MKCTQYSSTSTRVLKKCDDVHQDLGGMYCIPSGLISLAAGSLQSLQDCPWTLCFFGSLSLGSGNQPHGWLAWQAGSVGWLLAISEARGTQGRVGHRLIQAGPQGGTQGKLTTQD
jgi:hypothetical protein